MPMTGMVRKRCPRKRRRNSTQEIEQAIRQGGIFAGKFGGNTPREIGELLNPKVDWREVLKRFTRNNIKGQRLYLMA
jgi:hypothetical protein